MQKAKGREGVYIRRFICNRFKLIGISRFENKPISSFKTKILYEMYFNKFGEDPVAHFRRNQREEDKKKLKEINSEKSNNASESDFVYVIGNLKNCVCKIGYSKNPIKRVKELQTGCPYKLELFLIVEGNLSTEKLLHKKYKRHKSNGEWFFYREDLKDSVESLKNTEKDLRIKLLTQ